MAYLRNTWYVAAWSSEVEQGSLFTRKILGEQILFFRDEAGHPKAMLDRCSHRFAPLSMGTIKEGCIECPYHGLRFNSNGECVLNPHGDGRIPARAAINTYPTLERFGAIWVWMGSAEKADENLLPDFDYMHENEYYVANGYLNIAGNYELETDNILDLSHIEYVHPLFASPAVSAADVKCEIEGDTVWSKRDIDNDNDAPDFIKNSFNVADDQAVDRWLHVRWKAPALLTLYAGGVASGQPREGAIVSKQSHWFTPEDEKSTHYFYSMSAPKAYGPEAGEQLQGHIQAIKAPFEEEDKPIIEAQQRALGDNDFWDLKPIILNVDAAGVHARRLLKKMIDAEARE